MTNSDMTIAGISPGDNAKIKDKDLSIKHIKYHNLGLLVITKEEDKKKVIKKPIVENLSKEEKTQNNESKEKEEVNE